MIVEEVGIFKFLGRESILTVTIYDVARHAGVSLATVSRVVNGNTNVKPNTRNKVLQAIEDLGYRPNAVARGLASKKTTTIGVVLPDISSLFFAELARGIEDIANMYHYDIILSSSDQNRDREIQLINNLLEKQVDGLLFLGADITEEHRSAFNSTHVPIVLVSSNDPQHKIPSVRIDLEKAAYDAVTFLIDKGHTRIALLTTRIHSHFSRVRYNGYVHALKQRGIPFDEDLVVEIPPVYEAALSTATSLLKLSDAPTAFFTFNDEMAIGAIHAAQDLGHHVPNDIEVVGFNNTRIAQMVRPMLTTVVQPMYDIGAVAMRLLTKLINKEDTHTEVVLPHRLEIRQSTK